MPFIYPKDYPPAPGYCTCDNMGSGGGSAATEGNFEINIASNNKIASLFMKNKTSGDSFTATSSPNSLQIKNKNGESLTFNIGNDQMSAGNLTIPSVSKVQEMLDGVTPDVNTSMNNAGGTLNIYLLNSKTGDTYYSGIKPNYFEVGNDNDGECISIEAKTDVVTMRKQEGTLLDLPTTGKVQEMLSNIGGGADYQLIKNSDIDKLFVNAPNP